MTLDVRRLLVAALTFITALLLLRRRPVRRPADDGHWHPIDT